MKTITVDGMKFPKRWDWSKEYTTCFKEQFHLPIRTKEDRDGVARRYVAWLMQRDRIRFRQRPDREELEYGTNSLGKKVPKSVAFYAHRMLRGRDMGWVLMARVTIPNWDHVPQVIDHSA